MTISGIGGATQVQASGGVDPSSWLSQMQQMLGPVAKLFGETPQQLMSDLQTGKTSLSQLAQTKGISQTDLLHTIEQGLQQSSANTGHQLSASQLTNLANGIANRVHGGHHHHHGDSAASGSSASSNTTATSSSSSTNPLAAIEQDLQQLLTDLGSLYSANGSTATDALTQTSASSTDTGLANLSGQTGSVNTLI